MPAAAPVTLKVRAQRGLSIFDAGVIAPKGGTWGAQGDPP
jgi:hypothetical protein